VADFGATCLLRQTGVAAAGRAQKTYDIDRATHSRQMAQGVTPSKTLPQIEAEYTAAKADWATSNAPHYVASQTTIADGHASYAHALADAEETFATDYYPALETYLTAAAGYRRDRQVALAGVTMTYVSALAPALKTHDQAVSSAQYAYEQAAAGAKRAHTVSGDQAAYSAALTAAGQARSASTQTAAAAALRSTARGAEAGRIRGAAQAEKSFVVNEAGAWQTFVIAAAGHLETLLTAEAHAEYDLVEAVVTETAAYWMLATRAYADRMVLLAGTGSPWAQYHAAAEAARDREIAEAEAEMDKTIAKAQAQHQRAVNGAGAAYERADAEADAVLHDLHFVVVRLQLPPAGGGPPLVSSLLGAAEPLLVTELLGLHDFFGELSPGFAGDGTYLGIIDSLLARLRRQLGQPNVADRPGPRFRLRTTSTARLTFQQCANRSNTTSA
jgi:hypothetical protein